jgi:Zn-dependent M28 family amino/carboxypeptidase
VQWYPEPPQGNGFNTIAEIPGTDLKDQVVFIGAHLDGKHSAEAATDDGAGSAAAMEAVRILQRVGVRPRRTIRIGLWGGEELGILGSQAYIRQHYGNTANGVYDDESKKVSVYFNLDNGSGRVRGIWLQNNLAAEGTLKKWIQPLSDLGATTLARRGTQGSFNGTELNGGTDHLSFDAVGIPGFQLMQDRLEYFSRTSHSNMDYLDHASKDDLIQMSVVMAVLAYEASMADDELQRKFPPPTPLLLKSH